MSQNFVHLHVHSEYSLLDGAARIDGLIKRAVEMEMPALALTDHGVMYGVVDFYRKARKQGIHPVIGCEVYVAARSRFNRENRLDDSQYHLLLLAQNEVGYKNLTTLVSAGFLEGFYYKPRVDHQLLAEHSEGLIALSACLAGEIPAALLSGNEQKAKETAGFYKEVFGKDNFFLEMMDHKIPEQLRVNNGLRDLSRKLDIPLVVTNDTHYIKKEDARVHDVLLCIQTGKTIYDENRMRFQTEEFYLKSYAEMAELFPDDQDALQRTKEIADRCRVDFDFSQMHLPEFQVPEGSTLDSHLRKMCLEGLDKRFQGGISQKASDQLEHELKIISKMGFSGYFLIVQDFVNWARRQDIAVGPGRGSAAGSLVSYALGITDINPLKYGLLFERFLNPERVSMPDIDIDFCFERREEVIDYVVQKYGKDNVAQIITFGTMMARGAIRDVGRAINLPLREVDKIAKLVPDELGVTLEKALHSSQELKDLYTKDSDIHNLLDLAQAIEGMPRHASKHAAGVVIAKEPLINYLPLQKTGDAVITQFPKETVEDIGLLKMDLLGLRTLTVIGNALKVIAESYGQQLDIQKIPIDDLKTYELLSMGDSVGVFQLESTGMRHLLKNMKPSRFEDLIALVALYRPGPLGSGMVDDFINRKHGQTSVNYPHPMLEPVLNETYGVILYQEQVMQISCELAGFSIAQADSLRRAMGKKKPEVIAGLKETFISGSKERQVEPGVAVQVFELMEHFAGYGFNKSHSAAYALITYQTAYLKANYPVAFMAALLTSVRGNSDKVANYMQECRKMGLKVLPPDVNESLENFTVIGENKIRFGLAAVKNVGEGAVEEVIKARQKKSGFTTLDDFCRRVDLRHVNKRVVESLILCGAFDSLGVHRSQLIAVCDDCLEQAQAVRRDSEAHQGQVSFFDVIHSSDKLEDERKLPDMPEFPTQELLAREKELLGFYLSGHPLASYQELLASQTTSCSRELPQRRDGEQVVLGGIVNAFKRSTTKRGEEVIYFTLEDLKGSVEVIFFPRSDLKKDLLCLKNDALVTVRGKVSIQEDSFRVFGEKVRPLLQKTNEFFYLRIRPTADSSLIEKLRSLFIKNHGPAPVFLYFVREEKLVKTGVSFSVEATPELCYQAEELCGPVSCFVLDEEPAVKTINSL